MDALYEKSLELSNTIYGNASKVNQVSRQRAPFANTASELARVANGLAENVIDLTVLNRDTLAGSRKILDSMRQMTSAVDQGTGLISDVEDAIKSFANCFRKIEELASNISTTAKNIDMVSLVARVEAARASETGRNFTVVANEVKLLSEESASHAHSIREAIIRLYKAADEMTDRTQVLHGHLLKASERGSETRGNLEQISTIIAEATRYADLTNKEAVHQKESMELIDRHMGTLSEGVKASITGSAANMELVDSVLQLISMPGNSAADSTNSAGTMVEGLGEASAIIGQVEKNAKAVNKASVARRQIAAQASRLAKDARVAAEEGHQRLEGTQSAMDTAVRYVEQTLDLVADVDDASRLIVNASGTVGMMKEGFAEIEEMAAQIGGISSKTNILALNASIEASHAGDEGNGFAVVASEINLLAASAGGFVKEIDQLVSELSALTDGFNANMDVLQQAVRKLAEDGLKVTGEASELKDILQKTKDERSRMLDLLARQSGNMAELGEKSSALGNDAKTAVAGSARNIELCNSLLTTFERLTSSH